MENSTRTITVTLETEKMEALTLYLAKENQTPAIELQGALNRLYEITVPEEVRAYIEESLAQKKPS